MAVLERSDLLDSPCFGREFSRTADECSRCLAPVRMADGRLHLTRDVCRSVVEQVSPDSVLAWRPSAQDVRDRLALGHSIEQILADMIGPGLADGAERAARRLLGSRLSYLRRRGEDAPTLG